MRRPPGKRAREVLVLIHAGHKDYRIARELGIGLGTVRTIKTRLRAGGWIGGKR